MFKLKTLFSFFNNNYLNKNDITSHWVVHSDLKYLDTNDLFKKTDDWGYGSWTDWSIKNKFKTDNSAVTEETNVDEAITAEAKASYKMEMFEKNEGHKHIK